MSSFYGRSSASPGSFGFAGGTRSRRPSPGRRPSRPANGVRISLRRGLRPSTSSRSTSFTAKPGSTTSAWDGWFSRQGIAPFEVVYEDLEHDLHGVMRDALGFLGLRGQADLRASGQKQADEVSAEWIRRYRELAG
jgi:Stf0 sulphotransferase